MLYIVGIPIFKNRINIVEKKNIPVAVLLIECNCLGYKLGREYACGTLYCMLHFTLEIM
jgi:hypothetical protein